MAVPILADLREPPVVGQSYMVPTVRYRLQDRVRHWPVIGPVHDDAADLDFPHLHYHLDYRFLTEPAMRLLRDRRPEFNDDVLVSGVVLTEPNDLETSMFSKRYWGPIPRRPKLRRMTCQRASYTFTEEAREAIAKRNGGDKISERYGPVADPIRRRDGRLLCPHRKVDLSQFPPDENGIVTCPLHGLRVKCARDRDAIHEDAKRLSPKGGSPGRSEAKASPTPSPPVQP